MESWRVISEAEWKALIAENKELKKKLRTAETQIELLSSAINETYVLDDDDAWIT